MGLDMYLTRKVYLWKDEDKEEFKSIRKKAEELFPEIKGDHLSMLEFEAIYWRKANAIHQWFVDNIQEGNDDCGIYFVPCEDLQKLLNIVTLVLNDHDKASELLPVQQGFFFGSTEYDEYYFDDLEFTKKRLEEILSSNQTTGDFFYGSSW